MATCCPEHFTGFCLSNGTPIIIVVEGDVQTGWINVLTGVFTPGPAPVGTVMCAPSTQIPLDCLTDSVTVCQEAPFVVTATALDIRNLNCATDSVTTCQPNVGATISAVAASITSVTLLAANASRKGAIIYNDGSSTINMKFGAVASSTSFTVKILSQTYYELKVGYTGVIDGIWLLANGNARVTEFT